MAIPFRAKNPPERFPYVTVFLMAANTVVFAITSENLLIIREPIVEQFAISHETFSLSRMLTSMFLHADLLHLAGNMLFLWVFGAALEGRLKPIAFSALYLLAGFSGDLLHEVIVGIREPAQFALGASGAIMGLAGAYLWVFPYSTICVLHRTWGFGWGLCVSEWQARWVVLLYFAFDLLGAFLIREDGVGHFAHLGGFGAGFLLVLLLRTRRDSEEASMAQATRAELKDFSYLSFNDLDALMRNPTEDPKLVVAYCQKALTNSNGPRVDSCVQAVRRYETMLNTQANPQELAWVLLTLPKGSEVNMVLYLRTASRLEAIAGNDFAYKLYHRVYETNPQSPDSEMALFRMARMMENVYGNRAQARQIYQELLRLFPYGQAAVDARRVLQVQ